MNLGKILLIFFIFFCGIFFYQLILGKNGIIEGYKVKREMELLSRYKAILNMERSKYTSYLNELKKNPDSIKALANNLGYFDSDKKIIKIIEESKTDLAIYDYSAVFYQKYIVSSPYIKKIEQIKGIAEVIFYCVFGVFILLSVIGEFKIGIKKGSISDDEPF